MFATARDLPEGWVVSLCEHSGQLGVSPLESLDHLQAYAVWDHAAAGGRLRRRIKHGRCVQGSPF
jgi:hypothetical protein